MMSLSLCASSRCPLNKSARPTITRPRMVVRMPSHWLGARRRPRNATESRPVKMMTAPRSIWKLEALVMVRARNKQKRVFHLEIHTFISTTHKQIKQPSEAERQWPQNNIIFDWIAFPDEKILQAEDNLFSLACTTGIEVIWPLRGRIDHSFQKLMSNINTTKKAIFSTYLVFWTFGRWRLKTHLPTYMMEVAVMSHMAGGKKRSGLKLWLWFILGSGLCLSWQSKM